MAKKTFIPNWYLDKKLQKESKLMKRFIILILLINIVLFSFLINELNKTKKNVRIIENESINNNIIETLKSDTITIKKYKEISMFFQENCLNYKNMLITKDTVEIDIEVKSHEEYIYIIKCIEKQYSIKRLVSNSKNTSNKDFKVILEA